MQGENPYVIKAIRKQPSLKAGLKECGNKSHDAVHSDMKQLHFIYTFKPMNWKELDDTHRKPVLESQIFLKQKRDGKIKEQTVAGGNKYID